MHRGFFPFHFHSFFGRRWLGSDQGGILFSALRPSLIDRFSGCTAKGQFLCQVGARKRRLECQFDHKSLFCIVLQAYQRFDTAFRLPNPPIKAPQRMASRSGREQAAETNSRNPSNPFRSSRSQDQAILGGWRGIGERGILNAAGALRSLRIPEGNGTGFELTKPLRAASAKRP